MTDRFTTLLPALLAHEGGWVNDPRDPGGETNLGITRAVYEAWTHRPGADMRHLTPAQVAPIYRAQYWNAAGCDRVPAGVDYILFDTAVNMGVRRAVKYLQTAVHANPDGAFGNLTAQAVAKFGAREIIQSISAQREAKYRSLPTFGRFGRGWLRRLAEVTARSLADAA